VLDVSYNLSELFERVADAVPDRVAVVEAARETTYARLEERANRLAHHLAAAGVDAGDHVGLQMVNGVEYLEGMLAAFKLRAVPVNVNYRYVERELEYLFDNADLVALVFHRQFGPVVAAVAPSAERLRHLIVVEDGTDAAVPADAVEYEAALAAASPDRAFAARTADDVYIAYTGGTTGMPKGVMWRHEDIFFASMGGGDPTTFEGPITEPDQIVSRIPEVGAVSLITPPLMHVSAHWAAFMTLFGGGTVVIPRPGSFDPVDVLEMAARTRTNVITVVGDAMARPLIDAVTTADEPYDLSSLIVLASGGAMLSPAAKDLIREALPNVIVVDGYGSTETGIAASSSSLPGGEKAEGARFTVNESTIVLDDDLRPVEPGTGTIGRLARRGRIPLGYYKDAEKTAATFVEAGGVRWVLPGDLASVDADGTIVLHGRGSLSINTGGEKVFPEEVESVLIAHPSVQDVLVVGVPDERWGQRVVAVVAPEAGEQVTLDEIRTHCRGELAGYKVPRDLVIVERVQRAPNGKPDYPWAKERALAELG
jgi:acyl-CoA synthetase (AMP-forming)/AMP-acid ligase II